MAKGKYCEHCGAPMATKTGRGRPGAYCSAACRKAAQRRRRENETRSAEKRCEYCGKGMNANGRFCSDRCYYLGHGGIVPFQRLDLAAFDEELIPFIPRGQIHAHDLNRPAWHARVYGGDRSGRQGR